jgi:assimilatory nitrate reductase catalytic subunit
VNLGVACAKGWNALAPLRASERATVPLARTPRGTHVPLAWDDALRRFTRELHAVQARRGPDAAAFLTTGALPTEELAFLGALAKIGLGIRHGASVRPAGAAYAESFGFEAPPFTYRDLEVSDTIVLVGADLAVTHPILWQRIQRNRFRPEIVVVDPARTDTAAAATQHLAIRPGSERALFHGLARFFIARDWIDPAFIAAHTSGLARMQAHAAAFGPDRVCAETGLSPDEFERLARTVHEGRLVSFWWTDGSAAAAGALINLALVTGNIGRPGTGANAIGLQTNALGASLFGNTTSLLGGRAFANATDRTEVARILDVPVAAVPDTRGWGWDELLVAIEAHVVTAVWLVGAPARPDARLLNALASLELLVVQDTRADGELARLAHLILPSAGWGEKDGTYINAERRIGLTKAIARPPGQALADFTIFRAVAAHAGVADRFAAWTAPEAAFEILKALSAGRPCDFSGVESYRMLETDGGVQWPHPAGASPPGRERRLFADGRFFTADGRARLLVDTGA